MAFPSLRQYAKTASFNPVGITTGRFQCKYPNLSNIQKVAKPIPKKPFLVCADFRTLELVLLGQIADERKLAYERKLQSRRARQKQQTDNPKS